MTISAALSIQPGSSSRPAGAAPATGDAAAFAALIGGGLLKPMPVLVAADAAASGGQGGAVAGNAVPLAAPDVGPDILVAQPAGIPAVQPTPAVAVTGPLREAVPDPAPDILVDPGAPATAAPADDRPPVTDAAVGISRFRLSKAVTTLGVPGRAMPSTSPGKSTVPAASVSADASPPAAPEHDPDTSAADSSTPITEVDRAPDMLVDPSSPATVAPADDRPRVTDDAVSRQTVSTRFRFAEPARALGAADRTTPGKLAVPAASPFAEASPTVEPQRVADVSASARSSAAITEVDRAPDILVEPTAPTTAAPADDQAQSDNNATVSSVAAHIRFAKAMTALGVGDRATTAAPPSGSAPKAASNPTDSVPAAAPDGDAATSAPIADPTPPVIERAAPPDPRLVAAAAPTPLEPASEGASPSRRERSVDQIAVPLAAVAPLTAPPNASADALAPTGADPAAIIPPAAAMPPPSRADGDVEAAALPNRPAAPESQATLEPRGRAPLAADVAPSVAVAPLPVVSSPAPIAAGAIAPAGELFAAAIHAAGRPRPDQAADQASSLAPMLAAVPAAAVATGGTADRSLDLSHREWPAAMIEHIERLRDAADAVDTRIRLVPDALGGIDVSLRRQDDGVRVILSADQPATQAILAEARPRLDALAESRGIRLADAATTASGAGGFAGGAGGDPSNAHGRPRPAAFIPAAPARATPDAPSDPADGRVA